MAGAEGVKVLGTWSSPFVMRPLIALNLKGVEYEFVESLNPKSELVLQTNPVHKKVPVLIHNGNPICESLVIVQYIDETWSSGQPILPVGNYDRAIARFWAAYIDDKLFPSLLSVVLGETDENRASAMEQVLPGLQILEEAFATCSKGKSFFGGDTLGYQDIALGCFVGWIRAIEHMSGTQILDEAKVPNLAAWADRFCTHDAVKELVPEPLKLVEFAKLLRAGRKAAAAAPAK